jgi:WD40 repeat protein
VYSVGLSPSGKIAAFGITEDSVISVINVNSKSELFTLTGHKSTLNTILFLDEKTILSASDDKEIILWKLK